MAIATICGHKIEQKVIQSSAYAIAIYSHDQVIHEEGIKRIIMHKYVH